MKFFLCLIVSLLLTAGCGNDNLRQRTNTNNIQEEAPIYSAVLFQPNPNTLGGTLKITINSKEYLIGSKTPQNIQNQLYNYSPGNHNLQLKGNFEQESGHFPNPSATFDVIQITEVL